MDKVFCPKCNGRAVKNGFQSSRQRYKCRFCKNKFQTSYKYQAYADSTNTSIVLLLKESCGIRSIARILSISKNTVLTRILSIAKNVKPKPLLKQGCSYEMDEIWTFIGNKANVVWITYAIERKSRTIVGFVLGPKTKENIRPLVNQLILSAPKHIYTDRLNIYPSLVPDNIHQRFRYCTNIIERNNLTLRTHLKRLSRRTICFSRSFSILLSVLKIYFWG